MRLQMHHEPIAVPVAVIITTIATVPAGVMIALVKQALTRKR